MLSQGFNIMDPTYRGSTGFSLEFRESIKAEGWGGKEQDDIRCGIEALIAMGVAVRGIVGITGTSYGGYSAWCAITRFSPEVVAASAPICGMTDLIIVQGMQDPNVTPENLRAVVAALERAGVAYELLTFEDEGHGIYKQRNQKVLYQRLAEFFTKSFSTVRRV